MPDISMCPSPDCPARTYCRRNEASGTKPSEWRQAWIAFTWTACEGIVICDGYWPTNGGSARAADQPEPARPADAAAQEVAHG